MLTPAQQIFRKLVLHNKLASEAEIDSLLEQHEEPEHAVRAMIMGGSLKSKVGTQLLDLLKKEVDKLPPTAGGRVADRSHQPAAKSDEYVLAPPDTLQRRAIPAGDDDIMNVLLGDEPKPKGGSGMLNSVPGTGSSVLGRGPQVVPSSSSSANLSAAAKAAAAVPEKSLAKAAPPPPERGSHGTPDWEAKPMPKPAAVVVKSEPMRPGDRGLILKLLKHAKELGASDLHITPGLRPQVRISQHLKDMDVPPVPPDDAKKTLLALLPDEKRQRFLEHWDLDFCFEDAELGRFRTNYFMEQNGMAGVFRLIPQKVPNFEELRLPDTVRRFTEYRVGIVLVTGPKACGKTTTMAAMIDDINRNRREHIITLEDPIEYIHPCKKAHVSQREVGAHTQSFSNALRAALREAPDVILVGEMRDLETTSLAITAAETGHLVLASLHTPDATRTISAVLDVFPPKEQGQIRSMLSESLRGIVSQQLVPTKDGKGLELALEILVNKSSIANLIREERAFQIRGVMQTGRREGMMLLDDTLLKLYKEGKIDKEEVIVRATDEAYVMKELAGRKAEE